MLNKKLFLLMVLFLFFYLPFSYGADKIHVFFTCDVESTSKGNPEKDIWGKKGNEYWGITKIMDIIDKYGVIGNFTKERKIEELIKTVSISENIHLILGGIVPTQIQVEKLIKDIRNLGILDTFLPQKFFYILLFQMLLSIFLINLIRMRVSARQISFLKRYLLEKQ